MPAARPRVSGPRVTVGPPAPGGCQAGHDCARPACFRCLLEARSGSRPARRELLACATHLGAIVVTLTTWAQERRLAGAKVTVLAVDPAVPGPVGGGFVFTSFPVAR